MTTFELTWVDLLAIVSFAGAIGAWIGFAAGANAARDIIRLYDRAQLEKHDV